MPQKGIVPHMVVIAHNIRSAHNVGSILRTADAVGVEKIYLCGITPTPHDKFGRARPDIHKAALGAEFFVPWEYKRSVTHVIAKVKKEGYSIVALEQSPHSIKYTKIKETKNKKIALILGTETTGLPKTILKKADCIIEIPMRGKKESLNVAVAFGIAAFSITK